MTKFLNKMANTKIESRIFPKIVATSHKMFDLYCLTHNLDDSNVEKATDSAFISIIGTPDCINYYLNEPNTKHWFNEKHNNVLNLEFDDIATDNYWWKGYTFKGMTMEQATETVDFIERLVDEAKLLGDDFKRNIYVHCKAGKSRSVAIAAFLRDFYPEYFTAEYEIPETYNHDVYAKLSRVYYLKHGSFGEKIENE